MWEEEQIKNFDTSDAPLALATVLATVAFAAYLQASNDKNAFE